MITVTNLHAEWCQPCKYFEPVFKSVSEMSEFKDLTFNRYDIETDKGFELCEKYHVKTVPTTLILDENDEELYKVIGSVPKTDLIAILKIAIDKNNNKTEKE